MNTTDLGSLPFPEAATAWLESRKDFLGKRTYRDYVIYVRTLSKFFGNAARLDTFTADDIRRYQHSRLQKAIGSSINKETSILQQLLKRTGRWSEIGHDYQPLPTSKESRGRALTDAERAPAERRHEPRAQRDLAVQISGRDSNGTACTQSARRFRF